MHNDIKNVDFAHSKIAIARFGGPIAVTRNPDHIVIYKADDYTKDKICFFTNSG